MLGYQGYEPLPYLIPDVVIENFTKQLEMYTEIETEVQGVLNAGPKPQIEHLIPLLGRLKKIKIRSQLQEDLQSMAVDHSFVLELWKKICDMTA